MGAVGLQVQNWSIPLSSAKPYTAITILPTRGPDGSDGVHFKSYMLRKTLFEKTLLKYIYRPNVHQQLHLVHQHT